MSYSPIITEIEQYSISLLEIRTIQIKASQHLIKLPRNRLLQLMGMLGAYSYSMALRWSAIAHQGEGDDKTTTIYPDKLKELAAGCSEGLGEMTISVLWLQNYLKRNWKGACSGPASIRCMQNLMRDKLGLFDFERREKGTTEGPPETKKVDFAKLLIVYELAEKIFLGQYVTTEAIARQQTEEEKLQGGDVTFFVMEPGDINLDALPKHRGATYVNFFNVLFDGVAKYFRDDSPEDIIIHAQEASVELPTEVVVPEKKPLVLVWRSHWNVAKKIWYSMVKKVERLTSPADIDWDWLAAETS